MSRAGWALLLYPLCAVFNLLWKAGRSFDRKAEQETQASGSRGLGEKPNIWQRHAKHSTTKVPWQCKRCLDEWV